MKNENEKIEKMIAQIKSLRNKEYSEKLSEYKLLNIEQLKLQVRMIDALMSKGKNKQDKLQQLRKDTRQMLYTALQDYLKNMEEEEDEREAKLRDLYDQMMDYYEW